MALLVATELNLTVLEFVVDTLAAFIDHVHTIDAFIIATFEDRTSFNDPTYNLRSMRAVKHEVDVIASNAF